MSDHWTDEQEEQFLAIVNRTMQGSYSATLGTSPRAYDISDKLGAGFRHATHVALREMGLRS